MKYKIINVFTGQDVDPVALIEDMIARDKLFRLPMLFNDEFHDLKIVPLTQHDAVTDATQQGSSSTPMAHRRRRGQPANR